MSTNQGTEDLEQASHVALMPSLPAIDGISEAGAQMHALNPMSSDAAKVSAHLRSSHTNMAEVAGVKGMPASVSAAVEKK